MLLASATRPPTPRAPPEPIFWDAASPLLPRSLDAEPSFEVVVEQVARDFERKLAELMCLNAVLRRSAMEGQLSKGVDQARPCPMGPPTALTPAQESAYSVDQEMNKGNNSGFTRAPSLFIGSAAHDSLMPEAQPCLSQDSSTETHVEEGYEIISQWNEDVADDPKAMFIQTSTLSKSADSFQRESRREYTKEAGESVGWTRYVIASPSSPSRIAWELCGTMLVMYDLILLPMQVFDPPRATFKDVVEYISLFFWLLNVFASCTQGYVVKGMLVRSPRRIFMRYMKTWFLVDVWTVVPDWVFAISSLNTADPSGAESFTKLLRVLRLLRLARLMRLVKLRDAWNHVYDLIDSEKIGIVLDVLKMVFMLLLVNHYVACAWFFVAMSQTGESWLKYYGFTRAQVDWGTQYVTSYHWSITQFTPSSMHVQPQHVTERVFAIVVVVFALVGFSYLVGSITGSLARLRSMAEEETKAFWTLRRFLKRNRIPKELGMRIKSYVEARYIYVQHRINPSSVKVLSHLSEQLNNELFCALHGPNLCIHPLLEQLQEESAVTLQRLAIKAVSTVSLAPGDFFFLAGEAATSMSIVTHGWLQYTRMVDNSPRTEDVEHSEDWIAEPVLWVSKYSHLGEIKAINAAELVCVAAGEFYDVVHRNPRAFRLVSLYAQKYVVWLNDQDMNTLSDISQGEDVADVVREFISPSDLSRSTLVPDRHLCSNPVADPSARKETEAITDLS